MHRLFRFKMLLQLCLIINEEKCNVEVRLLFNVDLQEATASAAAIFHDDELYKIKCRMFQHGEKMKMCSLKKIFFFPRIFSYDENKPVNR